MSMRHCESNRAVLGGPNVRELIMQSLRGRHREDGEKDWGPGGYNMSLQRRERDSD